MPTVDGDREENGLGRARKDSVVSSDGYSGNAKLTPKDIVAIRRAYAADRSQESLADEYGVSVMAISLIVRGERWPDVGGPIATRAYARLTAEDVVAIRRAYAGDRTQASLADDYDVTEGAISNIVRGERWPDAGGPIAKSRTMAGEENPNAKVTADDVVAIRRAYAVHRTQASLADDYDVTVNAISNIVRGERWPDAGGPIA